MNADGYVRVSCDKDARCGLFAWREEERHGLLTARHEASSISSFQVVDWGV